MNNTEITNTCNFCCRDTVIIKMTSYLNNGDDIINLYAEFEKFSPYSITASVRRRPAGQQVID